MCSNQMVCHIFLSQLFIANILIFASAESDTASKEIKVKQMIESAGCPFVNVNQFLSRYVCRLPGYQANEIPKGSSEPAQIVVNLFSAVVLEVNERENRLRLKLSQFLQWFDPGIKLSKTKKPDKMGIVWLPQKNIDRIWHPDLDMYTENLEEWKSLHEPNVYRKLVILINPDTKGPKKPGDIQEIDSKNVNYNETLLQKDSITQLGGLKAWKATIRCVFDFDKYPFDVQRCKFIQFGNEGMELDCKPAGNRMEWKQKLGGFHVDIQNVGKQGNDSVGFEIILERSVEPYFYQYYIPSMAIVFVSQISFIIPLNAIPGRVALVATQFLTLVNIFIHQTVSLCEFSIKELKPVSLFDFIILYLHFLMF